MSVAVPPTPVSATLPKPALTKGTYKGSGGILGSPAQKEEGEEEKGHLRYPAHRPGPESSWKYPNVNYQLAQFRWKGQLYYV